MTAKEALETEVVGLRDRVRTQSQQISRAEGVVQLAQILLARMKGEQDITSAVLRLHTSITDYTRGG